MINEQPKTFEIPKYSNTTESMVKEFIELVDYLDIQVFRRNIRSSIFHFISTQPESLSGEFQKFTEQLPIFFDFLDSIENEQSKKKAM